jgi:hypothetical protein
MGEKHGGQWGWCYVGGDGYAPTVEVLARPAVKAEDLEGAFSSRGPGSLAR